MPRPKCVQDRLRRVKCNNDLAGNDVAGEAQVHSDSVSQVGRLGKGSPIFWRNWFHNCAVNCTVVLVYMVSRALIYLPVNHLK
ncbi:hypothetical protein AVEN_47447-1 [Araneus ventricosus]|uniref:Uncharacterized protein n=1 Tax=Araneus ventricosus TaxID=182803 RepID=A0A4Y2A6J3_ARAVE|nr:hypothetical protein AVEN_195534-1 [Araneus ventricosus]GBL74881.1 hypothetical protein AVEN_223997-1 [Araneus ventricosus]GBL74901.1 hypothetical protein AVEN_33334-1 [Araneus ventricosus]GBL74910.1 hypothetical protein AVEN_47447-1 [Araneus ventricosus]